MIEKGDLGVSMEGLAVVGDDSQWIAEQAARWAEVDAAPAEVAALAEAVYDAGPSAVGRACYEFVDGRLYEVRLERADQVPRVRVVEEVDTADLPAFHASMKTIAMTVASALLLLAVVLLFATGSARAHERHVVARRARILRRGGLGVSPIASQFVKPAL